MHRAHRGRPWSIGSQPIVSTQLGTPPVRVIGVSDGKPLLAGHSASH